VWVFVGWFWLPLDENLLQQNSVIFDAINGFAMPRTPDSGSIVTVPLDYEGIPGLDAKYVVFGSGEDHIYLSVEVCENLSEYPKEFLSDLHKSSDRPGIRERVGQK